VIGITAATGNIGRVLTGLLTATPVRLLVRDPSAPDAPPPAADRQIVAADLDRPDTLPAALDGVQRLFLLSPGPDTPAQDAAAIAAARTAGVEHVVLLSSLGVEAGGIGGGAAHAPGEQLLAGSGLTWTVLRPNEFMTNTLRWIPEITARGSVSLPTGNGRVGFVAPADIAAVAAAALLDPDRHTGKIHQLTGPAALTTGDAAVQLGAALGIPALHHDVSDEAFRAAATDAGMPPMVIEIFSAYYRALPSGVMDRVTDDIATITGRPATPFAAWAADAVAHSPGP
jgi:uncharacterized protein YbjT (DUF2867 family)